MVVDLLDALSPGDWLCRYQVLFKLHLVVLVQTIYSKPGTFLLSSDATVLLICTFFWRLILPTVLYLGLSVALPLRIPAEQNFCDQVYGLPCPDSAITHQTSMVWINILVFDVRTFYLQLFPLEHYLLNRISTFEYILLT